MLPSQHKQHWIIGMSALALLLVLGACSLGSTTDSVTTTTTTPSSTATSSATMPPSSTATATSTACAVLTGFGSAGAASTGSSHFSTVPFPSSSVSYITSHIEEKGYQYRLIDACTQNNNETNIRAYFAAQLPAAGWAQTSIFPLGGNPASSCGDPYYWKRGSSPTLYVGLEFLSGEGDNGTAVTYDLRLIIPPLKIGDLVLTASESVNVDTGQIFLNSDPGADIHYVAIPQLQALAPAHFAANTFTEPSSTFDPLMTNVTFANLAGLTYNQTNGPADWAMPAIVMAFQAKSGHLVKVLFGPAGSSATEIFWITYPYGF